MEIKQIEIFVAVVRHKNFSKAADALYLSQSAVTSNIQKLEQELGVVLIDRSRRRMTLTESGEIFYSYATEILNLCQRSLVALHDHKKSIEGMVEICASSIPEQYLLPYLIRDFRAKYPDVVFSIRHKDSREVIDEIHAGKINFGLIGAKYPSDFVSYTDLYEDRLVLIASARKVLPQRNLKLADLAGQDIVMREEGSGTRHSIEGALKKAGFDLSVFRSVTISDSLEAIKKMVCLDLGISFVSEVAVKRDIEDGLLQTRHVVDLDLRRCFSLVCSNSRVLSPLEEEFRDFARNWRWQS